MRNIPYTIIISLLLCVINFGQLTVKDQEATPNTLLLINDEGSGGSILLPELSSITSSTDNKLYNLGGTLNWNGAALNTGGSSLWSKNSTNIYYNSGNVGIGTMIPIWELEVVNPTPGDGVEVGVTANDAGGAIAAYSSTIPSPFDHFGGRVSLFSGLQSTGLDIRADGTSGDIKFYTGGPWVANERMKIASNGFVSIGTATPHWQLHIKNPNESHVNFKIEDNDGMWGTFGVNDDGDYAALSHGKGVNEYWDTFVMKDGKVGIGTNSPSSLLCVGGSDITSNSVIYAQSYATSGRAIYGSSSGGTGRGVYGVASSTTGRGVQGYALHEGLTVVNYGGIFRANGGLGFGLKAFAEGSGATAIHGYATHSIGNNYGIYGETSSPNGYAGYFEGRLHCTGILSKGGGSFKIDHPLDPTNKNLYHSFVESPDMMNIYNGIVELDMNGEATVEMPDWFEALNMDFRYQLTCIGGFAPIYIAEKINSNRFKIAGGNLGMEVSWQVTGIRHDVFAEKNRIVVEEYKNEKEKGKYLHPNAYGMPITAGVDYDERVEQELSRMNEE